MYKLNGLFIPKNLLILVIYTPQLLLINIVAPAKNINKFTNDTTSFFHN